MVKIFTGGLNSVDFDSFGRNLVFWHTFRSLKRDEIYTPGGKKVPYERGLNFKG